MERKQSIDTLILQRVNDKFNKVLPIGGVVSILTAVVIYFTEIPNRFIFIDGGLGLILLALYFLRYKVPTQYKILATILLSVGLAVLSFMDGGFSSGAITLIILANGIAMVLLPERNSFYVGIISMITLTLLWVWSSIVGFVVPIEMHSGVWFVQWSLLLLFIIVFRIVYMSIRRYLEENMRTLEDSVEITKKLAYYDHLTGLPNHHYLIELMHNRAQSELLMGYVVLVNIRSLNMINAIYGNDMGDDILREAAKALKLITLEHEIIARNSGNEYVLWIPVDSIEALYERLNQLRTEFFVEFKMTHMSNQIEYYISFAPYDNYINIFEDSYQKAALAMTYAKYWGKHDVVGYDEIFEENLIRMNHLKQAIREDIMSSTNFRVVYQPQVSTVTGEVEGVEALSRWHNIQYGPIRPDEFIPLIEGLNLHKQFGKMVLLNAMKDYDRIVEKYDHHVDLAVNISPIFLFDIDFVDTVKNLIEEARMTPEYLVLEITEDFMIESLDRVNAIIKELKTLGVKFSIDDFGVGYSSLNYLANLDVDELKIDKALIDTLVDSSKSKQMLKTIVDMAKGYNLTIVAEGIETKDQKEIVKRAGCDRIQGFYYARPESVLDPNTLKFIV